ncbi:hypothetical protein KIH87_01160 [Paraneptunicella aestuarii]|uniref:hypothetical protein n=1 Tax=Paraneptunicella aestuarii TaxID=2831148 RepID=UPI001E31BE9A|nr:hypothetical protein [Paraneptunicella aestuarii]UAA39009.1 hypothetical protein KIH87_01160 [Paraneptunicella aestuarii]
MMKLKSMSAVLLAVASVSSFASFADEAGDSRLVFVGDTEFSSFCRAAVKDDVSMMRRSFTNKVGVIARDKRDVYEILLSEDNLACNGMGIIEFSKQRNSEQVVSYLQSVQQKS